MSLFLILLLVLISSKYTFFVILISVVTYNLICFQEHFNLRAAVTATGIAEVATAGILTV